MDSLHNMKTALLLVDLQNDFMPNGSLPVPRGDEVIRVANRLQIYFDRVIATQDWHPPHHISFAANHPGRQPGERIACFGGEQVLWPIHCVQNTNGAALVSQLNGETIHKIIYKGTDPEIDSYSAFFDNARQKETPLADYLKQHTIQELYVMGVALEYCVQYTVLDACALGFKTYLIVEGCRGISPDAEQKAIRAMQAAGAQLFSSAMLSEHFHLNK